MTLEEFIRKQREAIGRFLDHWQKEQQGPNAEYYPNEMEPGEWDEMWRAWEDMEQGR